MWSVSCGRSLSKKGEEEYHDYEPDDTMVLDEDAMNAAVAVALTLGAETLYRYKKDIEKERSQLALDDAALDSLLLDLDLE
jgi:hypothetical protein